MGKSIEIEVNGKKLKAILSDSAAAKKVADALPLRVAMSRWGDEYYGGCGLDIPEDPSAREMMEVGEIAYWSPGKALCIFFGPTPASTDERPRAASPVLPIGRIEGDISFLKSLGSRAAFGFRA